MTRDEIRENASNYWFVWGAGIDQAEDFRISNPNASVGRYLPAFLDDHNGRPDGLLRGQDTPETRARTLRWWLTEADGVGHPDWILYRCDGVTPAYGEMMDLDGVLLTIPNMPLDITNPAVIDWQARDGETQSSFTAFSADMVDLRNANHACGVYRNGQWVQLFSGAEKDPAFSAAVINWGRQMRQRLASQRQPKGLVVNYQLYPSSDEEIAGLIGSVDAVLDEQGFTGYGLGRRYVPWQEKISRMIEIQSQGGAVYSLNYVQQYPPTQDDTEWILGSFLMAREHSAYIAITGWELLPSVRWPHRPEFDEDIGHPCAPMRSAENVYVRDYSKGLAVVNPSPASSYAVTLPPGSFRDLQGQRIEESGLVLGPLTGRVLLSSAVRCP